MSFTNPNAGALPASGAVNFEWTSVQGATHYIFYVNLPNQGGNDLYDLNGISKVLYMENYTVVGSYQAVVQARDSNADILCTAQLDFTKQLPAKKKSSKPSPNPTSAPTAIRPPP